MEAATGNLRCTLRMPTPKPTAGGPKKCLACLLWAEAGWASRARAARASWAARRGMVAVVSG